MRRAAKGTQTRARSALALLPVVLLAGGGVFTIASLARTRAERQLTAAAAASVEAEPQQPLALQAEPPSANDAEGFVEKLLAVAAPADASVAALDAAAHALLVRERFEEAEPLVLRTLSAAPTDAEANIHQAVLHGVMGHAMTARAELERLAHGPAGWEASLFAAGFALRDGDDAAALRALRRFRAEAPSREVTPQLLAELAELEVRAEVLQKKSLEK